ncbi:TonB-dependent receptor domain-containing protein [Maricaulis parjimensis]|uniref:TonB-dependent receptor domain-containing protein n=1 Tax=Maricaulis parjimensis TaxID=144023 RepID=UPI00193974B8|nr:TonB-dependent receptor [Maricaulis parjimensis]
MQNFKSKRLYTTTAIASLVLFAATPAVMAQTDDASAQGSDDAETIVVTGSRIRRSASSTAAPVAYVGEEVIEDRGFISAADIINNTPSMAPQLNQADGSGNSSGDGQQYPALFGLGAGRTLTLVNGRRYVTTSSGMGEARVDSNIIPTGLIERVEIVQGGGASVYGSDAIAGVVNYILKDDFEGMELDVQFGDSWEYNDYDQPSVRLTGGHNFDSGRGNIAFNAEYSSSPMLQFSDRPRSNLSRITQGNALDTGPNDGIPAVAEVIPAYFWNFNTSGIVYSIPAPLPMFLTSVNGAPAQFAEDGSVIAYDPGNILGIPFAEGGQGFRYSELAGLRTGVERQSFNLIGHYDLTPEVRLNAELLYAATDSEERAQGHSRTVLNGNGAPFGAIMFNAFNPFLTPEAIASLSSANPGFAFGAPMWLSKHFDGQLAPTDTTTHETDTLRAMVGLEGEFSAGDSDFYWTVSGSFGRVEGESFSWGVLLNEFENALAAVSDGAGGAVCSINVDADPTNDDPNCAPLNPFGFGNISDAARAYVTTPSGEYFVNEQVDFLATLGSSLFDLPAGPVDYVLAYEHRSETADFTPFQANQLGLVGTGATTLATSGDYNTNEVSAEVLVPIVGGDFTLPFMQELEFSGSYRLVDNSIAGEESVWGAGLRWRVTDSLMLRASQSRNFRAPTLTQLFAPTNTAISNAGIDPCDADRIDTGPNPAVRRANCEAEWAANPAYGDLATFQDPAENFSVTTVTTGGNRDLENEISDTTTFGFVFEPSFVPGLTLSVDRMEIELTDGLVAFTTADFMAACYDNVVQPVDMCSAFTRLAASDGTSPAGTVVQGRTTTVNAGLITFKGEVISAQYAVPLDAVFSSFDPGQLTLGLEATHTASLTTAVVGSTEDRTDNTAANPDWTARFDAIWTRGPVRLTYQLSYLDEVLASANATIESTPNPVLDANYTHSISGSYEITDDLTLRAGITNLTNEEPSYPSLSYGDILGRRYFVGANFRF